MLTSPCSMFKDFATGLMVVTYSSKKAMSAGLYLIEKKKKKKKTYFNKMYTEPLCNAGHLFIYVPTADNVVSITLTK